MESCRRYTGYSNIGSCKRYSVTKWAGYFPPLQGNIIKLKEVCSVCRGSGQMPKENICPSCDGARYKEHEIDLEALQDQIDSIIAEQASQREDLTAALTQIWNKVKDL